MSFHDFAMCFCHVFVPPNLQKIWRTRCSMRFLCIHACTFLHQRVSLTKPLYVFLFVSISGVRFRLSVVQVCLLFARLVGLNAPTCQSWNLSISFDGLGKCSHDDTKASCTWVRGSYLCGSSQLLKAWIIKKLRALHTSCWKCSWSSLAMSFTTLGFQHGEQFPCQWHWSILKFWTHILDCSHDDT